MSNPATLPDLMTAAEFAGYSAGLALSPAQLAQVPTYLTDASAAVRSYCKRLFTLWTFDERYTAEPPSREITLRQFPVVSLDTIASGPAEVLTIAASASAQRATVALATTGSDLLGFVVTGLTLTSWVSGVKAVQAVTIGGTTPTVTALAAAVNALGSPWSAVVTPGYELWAASEIVEPLGARSAAGGKSVGLVAYVDDLDYSLRAGPGIVSLGADQGDATDSPRWGPLWPGEVTDAPTFGGNNGIRCVYTAGFAAVPADVAQVVAELVKLGLERFEQNTSLKSESDGVLSWTAADLETIPAHLAHRLNPYVNHRA